jgi:uncharacterized membrane protein YfcA
MLFPALVFAGIDPSVANVRPSMITVPGGIASAMVYRRGMTVSGKLFWTLIAISVAGGVIGSQLLPHAQRTIRQLCLPDDRRRAGLHILRPAAGDSPAHILRPPAKPTFSTLGTLAISIYGGYFGAGWAC